MSDLDEAAIRRDERRRAAAFVRNLSRITASLAATVTPFRTQVGLGMVAVALETVADALGRGAHLETEPDPLDPP